MRDNKPLEGQLHFIMAMVGGFLGAYAILNRTDIFGSAQTVNIIELVMGFLDTSFVEVLFRIIALVLTISAFVISTIIPKHTRINLHVLSIVLDMIVIVVLGFMPKNINSLVALYPIFFVTAFQWSSFKGVNGFYSSTIFSTNNLKQTVISFTEYLYKKDKNDLDKAKFFGTTILYFHIGVIISYLSTEKFGIQGAWIGFFPLMIALGISIYNTEYIQSNIRANNDNSLGL